MLLNFLKIGVRSLWKNKIYSFINIAGLSLGIAVCILILTFVAHEYSYDKFHSNIDKIFLKVTRLSFDGRTIQIFSIPEFGPSVKASNPVVQNYCRLLTVSDRVIKPFDSNHFFKDRVLFTDDAFFSMFSFELLKGNRESLSKPYTILLTEEIAAKYFGEGDAIGKTINFDKGNLFEVVGIVKKAPSNSTIQYDLIASINSLEVMPAYKGGYLGNPAYQTYLLLNDPAKADEIAAGIAKAGGNAPKEEHVLEPLAKIHFNNTAGGNASPESVFIFLCVSLFVLALAIINYANLTTARATVRAKEVAVRKISGARNTTLSLQFYTESLLITTVSFALAFVAVELLSPLFQNMVQQNIDRTFFASPIFLSMLAGLFLVCVLLSGSYPALLLPKFKPVDIMKGKIGGSGNSKWVRNSFATFQFGISLILVICSFIVQNQLDFLSKKEIGLQKEQVMVVPVDASAASSYTTLKNEIRQQSGVQQVGAASIQLYRGGYNLSGLETPTTHEPVGVSVFTVDETFFETLGLKWEVKPEKAVVPGNYLVNKVAVDKLKIAGQPLGQKLSFHDEMRGMTTDEIAGVVQDFNFTTLKAEIDALVMTVESDTGGILKYGGSLYVRVDPSVDLTSQISEIRKIYEKYQSEIPFEYYFLDDAFDNLHKNEQQLSSLSNIFTAVAVCIACLGLFGLVTFITETRTKEIGIRKVLGASVNRVLMLISKDLMLIIVIAIVFAAPIAYVIMDNWLRNFAYKIEMQWTVFLAASVSLLLVALLTVSYQAIRAAFANPVDALRNE